jgi:Fe-S cluster biogenesis protein NfuA
MEETRNPQAPPAPADPAAAAPSAALLARVQQAIDEVRPALQADGGDIEFLGLTDDLQAKVRLVGACSHCPSSSITLSYGVENYLRERVPEVKGLALDGMPGPFGFHGDFEP